MRVRISRLGVLAAVAIATAFPSLPARAGTSRPEGPVPSYADGEVLLRYRSGVAPAERAGVRADVGARIEERLPVPGLEVVTLPDGASVEQTVAELERDPDVLYAEPNYLYRLSDTLPDDDYFGQLWGLRNTGQQVDGVSGTPDADIDAPAAWDHATGSSGVVVGVVDTGVDYLHDDLAPNIWSNPGEIAGNGVDDDGNGKKDDVRGWDFVGNDAAPSDPHGHGTHVSGTIGARGDDGHGVAGVNWDVSIMALRVCDSQGYCENDDIVAAFAYAGDNGADVVNVSLGGGDYSQAMRDAIADAPGTLFVAAAGNEETDNDVTPSYPCNYTTANLICVAATDQDDELASFSNYGDSSVDLGAPGTDVLSTFPGEAWAYMSGTSMATPHVTGAAALLKSYDGSLSPTLIKSALLDAVDPLDALAGKTLSGGRLNVAAAIASMPTVQLVESGGSTRPTEEGETDSYTIALTRQPEADVELTLVTDPEVSVEPAALTFTSADYAVPQTVTVHSAVADDAEYQGPRGAVITHASASADPDYDGIAVPDVAAQVTDYADDTEAPTGAALTGVALKKLVQGARSFTVGWTATDALSGVASYQVQYRRSGSTASTFASYTTWKSATSASSASFKASYGYTYCFRVRATDRGGNPSDWSAEKCTTVPLNDRQLSRDGTWYRYEGSGYYAGTFTLGKKGRVELERDDARAKRITLVATRCPGCGVVDVYLGAKRLKRVSLGSSSWHKRSMITVASWSTTHRGKVRIRVVDPRSKGVRIEGLALGK